MFPTRLNVVISEVFSPFTLPGVLVTLIAISTDPSWGTSAALALIFIVGIPFALSMGMHRSGKTTDRYIQVRKQRTPFYIGTLLSLLTGAITLNIIDTSHEVTLALNLSVVALIVVMAVNFKIKVSIHALSAALFAVVFPLYTPFVSAGYVAGVLIWASTVNSRYALKRHSGPELVLGTFFGVALAVSYLALR